MIRSISHFTFDEMPNSLNVRRQSVQEDYGRGVSPATTINGVIPRSRTQSLQNPPLLDVRSNQEGNVLPTQTVFSSRSGMIDNLCFNMKEYFFKLLSKSVFSRLKSNC